MRLFRANTDDVPRIMECAREFCAIIPDCPLDEVHYETVWRGLLRSGDSAIFLLEQDGKIVGGIGGSKHPDLLSGKHCAVELFWYVKPEFRGSLWAVRLLHKFEQWANEVGCWHVAMIHLECSMPQKLKEFYVRNGYTHIESTYRKRVLP